VSLRRFAAAPEREGPGGLEVFADSDEVSAVGEVSVGGWLTASGLCEAHPETPVRTQVTKPRKSANLKEPIFKAARAVGSIRKLYCWTNCCRGVAAFTGDP
jgi:hypothetical protein